MKAAIRTKFIILVYVTFHLFKHFSTLKLELFFFVVFSGPWWELSCAALQFSLQSQARNAPNTPTWIPGRPSFTSTRRISEWKKTGKAAFGLFWKVNSLVESFLSRWIIVSADRLIKEAGRVVLSALLRKHESWHHNQL